MPYFSPVWPSPSRVKSIQTTREGGISTGFYDSNNLALHVGDQSKKVMGNRSKLSKVFPDCEFSWLNQSHSSRLLKWGQGVDADACYSFDRLKVCSILTADCLPVLMCDVNATWVAACHAGWRGLLGQIISKTVRSSFLNPDALMVWLGPCIGPEVYFLPEEHREKFLKISRDYMPCFRPKSEGMYWVNLKLMAEVELNRLGVHQIYKDHGCTFQDHRFYSYRRENGVTGRMASLIWLDD